ncbi:MAG: hypothetical protein IKO36_00520 [Bacteroidaceae bacterium]|nr:hypothetical protein [Bacteroidaceae bacterium]
MSRNHTKQSIETWKNEERSITLSNDVWNKLKMFLLMSTNYRNDERDGWRKLAEKKDEDGNPMYSSAADNVQFWDEQIEAIDKILETIR